MKRRLLIREERMQRVDTAPIIDSAVHDLWKEGMLPAVIAQKLGYPLDVVEDIIVALGSYANNVVGYVEGLT